MSGGEYDISIHSKSIKVFLYLSGVLNSESQTDKGLILLGSRKYSLLSDSLRLCGGIMLTT